VAVTIPLYLSVCGRSRTLLCMAVILSYISVYGRSCTFLCVAILLYLSLCSYNTLVPVCDVAVIMLSYLSVCSLQEHRWRHVGVQGLLYNDLIPFCVQPSGTQVAPRWRPRPALQCSHTFLCVAFRKTGGATLASKACFHRDTHRHHLSPAGNYSL